MFWLIFWLVVIVYWVVAVKRMPVYYRRQEEDSVWSERGIATEAIVMGTFWLFYEAGRWVQNTIIHQATKEQRRWDEYVKAEYIVKEYTERKEREDREAFDRALREN